MDYGMKKGNPGGAVMVAAKGRMAELLKKMMAAKLKARLGKAMGDDSEDESEGMDSEKECEHEECGPQCQMEESTSGENSVPEGELKQLLEMYSKLK